MSTIATIHAYVKKLYPYIRDEKYDRYLAAREEARKYAEHRDVAFDAYGRAFAPWVPNARHGFRWQSGKLIKRGEKC